MKKITLFRAWDKICNCYANIDKLYLNGSVVISETWATKDVILEQYFNLNDKKRTKEFPNGQPMYDGDLVICPYRFDGIRLLSSNKLGHVCTIDSNGQTSIDIYMLEEIEVVGTIHQNPELYPVLKSENENPNEK